MDLATRLRPAHVRDMWGCSKLKEVLELQLKNENRPQVYLFVGNAGTGKTTAARAYANDLGIDELNIEEINISDKTGVDFARTLIEEAQFKFGDKKAYILDEMQYATANMQSALLKLLEEPPAGVYYFICTTDPQKLSTAIKTRCTILTTEVPTEAEMIRRLSLIVDEEKLDVDDEVIEAIANKSESVPRRALKLLDKVTGIQTDKALVIIQSENSGDLEDPNILAICRGLLEGNSWSAIANNLKNVKGSDVEGIRRQILGYMAAVLVNKPSQKVACIMGYFIDTFFNSGYGGLVYACYCALIESKNLK